MDYELQVEENGSHHKRTFRRIAVITAVVVSLCVVAVVLAVTIPNSGNGQADTNIPYLGRELSSISPSSLLSSSSPSSPSSSSIGVPCNKEGLPLGCTQRFVPCGTYIADANVTKLEHGIGTNCKDKKHAILLGQWYIVQMRGADQVCIEILMQVGECWGFHPESNNLYSCQGKCGDGCGSIQCGAWARDCLRHDACSWYFTSKRGLIDADCGSSMRQAVDDYSNNCKCSATKGTDLQVEDLCMPLLH